MKSTYYDESVKIGSQFQKSNKNWAGFDVVKYQKQIQDLVVRYNAKTLLDYGCGKGLQYTESSIFIYFLRKFVEIKRSVV